MSYCNPCLRCITTSGLCSAGRRTRFSTWTWRWTLTPVTFCPSRLQERCPRPSPPPSTRLWTSSRRKRSTGLARRWSRNVKANRSSDTRSLAQFVIYLLLVNLLYYYGTLVEYRYLVKRYYGGGFHRKGNLMFIRPGLISYIINS